MEAKQVMGPPAPVARPQQASEDLAGLRKVAEEFEAMFLNTLLKSMRATVPESEIFGKGGATKIYQEWHDQELARGMARSGDGLGVGELIVRQFQGAVASTEAPGEVQSGPRFMALGDEDRSVAAPAPLPPPTSRQLASYRQQATAGDAIADMVRLRRLADNEGGAVADSLNRYQSEIWAASQETGLDPALLLAVLQEESAGDPGAVSHRGATGLMQLMPATAAEVGVDDILDPAENITGGARYLARMLRRFDGRLDLALGAYNAGPTAVEEAQGRVPAYAETRRYVRRVLARSQRLGGPGTDLADVNPGATARPERE